jgi:tetratricopeptide (TPR) repeat protein
MGDAPRRRRWGYALGLALLLVVVLGLLFPWGASAFYLERAGHRLDRTRLVETDYRAIERDLSRALAWHASNTQAYRLLARLYERQGQPVAAVEAWAQFSELQPGNPLALWELASACERLDVAQLPQVTGQICGTDEASRQAALLHLWQEMGQPAAAFVLAGDRLRQDGELAQAEAFYQRALLVEPASSAAWYGLAGLDQARGETAAALAAYARAILLSVDPALAAAAHEQRGILFAGAGQWLEASDELAQAVALAPEQGNYHLGYGWYLYQAGDSPETARAELSRAVELLPGSPWPHLRLAQMAGVEGDYDSMLAHAEAAVTIQPTLAWAWSAQGRALRFLGRLAEAEPSLRRAVELGPDNSSLFVDLGQLLTELGRQNEAAVVYEQAVELAPQNAWYTLLLADAYRANGQRELALETYQRVLELDPNNNRAQKALRDLGD